MNAFRLHNILDKTTVLETTVLRGPLNYQSICEKDWYITSDHMALALTGTPPEGSNLVDL